MTFISYPDLSATSGNSRFRVDVFGRPVDAFFRDQSQFSYRLYDANQLVWEYTPYPNRGDSADDSPHEVWVSNDGWVVARTHAWFHGGLTVFNPTGQVVLRCTLDGEDHCRILDDNSRGFVHDTSAGPFWSQSSIAYFFECFERPFWCLRTWWGYRVIIDLIEARLVSSTSIDDGLATGIERAWIVNTLSTGLIVIETEGNQLRQQEKFWTNVGSVMTAAYHAGWLQATQAIPFLRRLEPNDVSGGSTSQFGADLETLCFAQIAKLSLLRLGQEPQWYAGYRFQFDCEADSEDREVLQVPRPAIRDLAILKPGMTPFETLDRLGYPDFIRDEWEYDFTSPRGGVTARILWDESHLKDIPYQEYDSRVITDPPRISRIDQIEPQWKMITMRDHMLV